MKNHRKYMQLDEDLQNNSALNTLLDFIEIYYLNEEQGYTNFSNAIPSRVTMTEYHPNSSIIMIRPIENPASIWYCKNFNKAKSDGILIPQGIDGLGIDALVRFGLTAGKIKRWYFGLNNLSSQLEIHLYLKPKLSHT